MSIPSLPIVVFVGGVILWPGSSFKESSKLEPGHKITPPTKTTIGKLGMLICYDLRFPEMSRTLASSGSEILVVPSAWVQGPHKEEHWLALNKTRAIENGCETFQEISGHNI